jgi:hypothetical protein
MDGMVSVGDGRQIRALDLVSKLRAFRGRLTRRELCEVLGYGADNRQAFNTVCRLCRTYQISAAPEPRPDRPALAPGPALTVMQIEAKRQLAAEIAAHRDRLRLGLVPPPFKPGPLEW